MSISIPSGWATDAGFSIQNAVCTDQNSYTSTQYDDPTYTAAFVLNNEEGAKAASPTKTLLFEVMNIGQLTAFGSIARGLPPAPSR